MRDKDKGETLATIAGAFRHMGFELHATRGTHEWLKTRGIESRMVFKVREGRPDIVDQIKNGRIQLMINTPEGKKGLEDERAMRLAGLRYGVPCITTLEAGRSAVEAVRSVRAAELKVVKLQEIS